MANVLVTGASGFVGARLVVDLERAGHRVVALTHADGDVADPHTFVGLGPVDHVFHLAARTFVPDSWNDPLGFHRTNVLGTAAALEYCRHHEAAVTFISSYLYGRPEHLPVAESAPLVALNPYALSKLLGEQLCEFFAEHRGGRVTIARPFNLFGPGQRADFLVSKVITQAKSGREIVVENLEPRRDYLFVDDFLQGLLATMNPPEGMRVFNFGSGKSYSVGEVISTVQASLGTDLPVRHQAMVRVHEIAEVRADITLAERELGWVPQRSFEEGIRQTCRDGFC